MKTIASLPTSAIIALACLFSVCLGSESKVVAADTKTDRVFNRFQDWCEHAEFLPEKTKNLVDKMLEAAKTSDCAAADKQLMTAEELHLRGIFDDLRPIAGLKNVRRLYLHSNDSRTFKIEPIAQMTQLTHLSIIGEIKDIRSLRNLKNLTYLDLLSTQIQDIRPIASLAKLTYLRIGSKSLSGDLEGLSNLTNLRVLGISGEISSLYFLRKMIQLEYLSIPDSGIADVSLLAGLRDLKRLVLFKNPIQNVQPLAGLYNLIELDLRETQVKDLTPVSNLPYLQKLQTGEIEGLR
jgi:internalin A